VVSVIQRMEETGQPVNFNSVLDRLKNLYCIFCLNNSVWQYCYIACLG